MIDASRLVESNPQVNSCQENPECPSVEVFARAFRALWFKPRTFNSKFMLAEKLTDQVLDQAKKENKEILSITDYDKIHAVIDEIFQGEKND